MVKVFVLFMVLVMVIVRVRINVEKCQDVMFLLFFNPKVAAIDSLSQQG